MLALPLEELILYHKHLCKRLGKLMKIARAAEFVIYKLKEMGKISQEDISLFLKEFEELDVDQSGTLSVSDITLAQSS